jgi:hypothetical protein
MQSLVASQIKSWWKELLWIGLYHIRLLALKLLQKLENYIQVVTRSSEIESTDQQHFSMFERGQRESIT